MASDTRATVTPQLVIGVFITLLGVVLMLDQFGLVEARHVRPFWPLLLIALGASMLLQRRDSSGRFWGGVWTMIGAWMLLNALGWLEVTVWQLIGPLLLILIGGTVLAHAFGRQRPAMPPPPPSAYPGLESAPAIPPPLYGSASPPPLRPSAERLQEPLQADPDGLVSLFAVLGESKRASNDNPFRGGEMTAFLGGCVLDLRQATIPPGGHAVINVLAVMAGHEIRVPDGWAVASDIVPLLGGVDDKRRLTADPLPPTAPRVRLRGIVLMGGVVLKN